MPVIPLLALATLALPALAQERFSTIGGTVKDATGAVVPSVTVTLTTHETSRTTTAETGDSGVCRSEFKDVPLLLGKECNIRPPDLVEVTLIALRGRRPPVGARCDSVSRLR